MGELALFTAREAAVLLPANDTKRLAAELLALATEPALREQRSAAACRYALAERSTLREQPALAALAASFRGHLAAALRQAASSRVSKKVT